MKEAAAASLAMWAASQRGTGQGNILPKASRRDHGPDETLIWSSVAQTEDSTPVEFYNAVRDNLL